MECFRMLFLILVLSRVNSQMNYGYAGAMSPMQGGGYNPNMGNMPVGQNGQNYPMGGRGQMTEEEEERMKKNKKKNKSNGNQGQYGYNNQGQQQLNCELFDQPTCGMHYPYCMWDTAEPECDDNPEYTGPMPGAGGMPNPNMNGMQSPGMKTYPQGNMNPYNNGGAPYNQNMQQNQWGAGQANYNQMPPSMNSYGPPGQAGFGNTGYNPNFPGGGPGGVNPNGQFPNNGYGYNNHMLHSGHRGMNTYGASAGLPGNNYMGAPNYNPYAYSRRLQKNQKKLEKVHINTQETKTFMQEHIMHNIWFWLFFCNCIILTIGVTIYGLRTQNKFQIDQTLLYQEAI